MNQLTQYMSYKLSNQVDADQKSDTQQVQRIYCAQLCKLECTQQYTSVCVCIFGSSTASVQFVNY